MTTKKISAVQKQFVPITSNDKIVVIGGSAGGFAAVSQIIKNLPQTFDCPIFIVLHMPREASGILPDNLNRIGNIYAAHAIDREIVCKNRIYVAPPDYHLIVEKNHVRVTKGPRENRFRPAIDPLFRSAAHSFQGRVIGLILSGALDDGVAGLWAIKKYGGIAVIQDPREAEIPFMPQNATNEVDADYIASTMEIAGILTQLQHQPVIKNIQQSDDAIIAQEIKIASQSHGPGINLFQLGDLTPFSCPECHGVLSKFEEGDIVRYRCHTGHAYSADILLSSISEKVENALYSGLRGLEETILLLNHMGDHYAESNKPQQAAYCFKKAKDAFDRSLLLRKAIWDNEILGGENIKQPPPEKDVEIFVQEPVNSKSGK